ncbi:MAG: glutamine synthetase family protein [Acidimicrobiales bacterium]
MSVQEPSGHEVATVGDRDEPVIVDLDPVAVAGPAPRPPGSDHRGSFARRAGVVDDAHLSAVAAIVADAAERKLHSVRVSFVDQHGLLRTKTVAVTRLAEVFADGVGVTGSLLAQDTGNQFALPLWRPSGVGALDDMIGARDMVMLPDPTTWRLVPWAEGTGWLLCDLYSAGARPLPLSTRGLCRDAVAALADAGYRLRVGLELELHLFDAHTMAPIHPGWELLGDNHLDRVQARLEPLRLMLEALGVPLRSLEIEQGPGQIELTFAPTSAFQLADEAVLVRAAISQVARRNEMIASFMCRPPGPDSFPSGWHLHQSLTDGNHTNMLSGMAGEGPLSTVGRHWVGGLLAHATASCLLSTPTVNGYKRYRPNSVAPDRVAWGEQHRGAMLRIIGGGDDPSTRIENRVGEPAANPYLYVAAQLVSGLDGLRRKIEPPPVSASPYRADAGPLLPRSLGEAIERFGASELYRSVWGDDVVEYLTRLKTSEWNRFLAAVTDWEQREYFELF